MRRLQICAALVALVLAGPAQGQQPAPPPSAPTPGVLVRIDFAPKSTDLPSDVPAALSAMIKSIGLAEDAQGAPGPRIQIIAFASRPDDARRISLERALAVRTYLTEHGVRATRMDVRALGAQRSEGREPSDRVEIVQVR